MPLMDWNDTLSVGITTLDDQHKKLIALLNKLHDAMRAGTGQKVVGPVLADLLAYTRQHFAGEEQLLRMYSYPAYAAHASEHAKLTAEVVRLQQELQKGNLLTFDVMNFLRDWLTGHIMETDKKYTACLTAAKVA